VAICWELGGGGGAVEAHADVAGGFAGSVAEIKLTQRLHTWMLGVNTAMIVVLIGKAFLS
jgi:hypothetical protein